MSTSTLTEQLAELKEKEIFLKDFRTAGDPAAEKAF